MDDLQRLVETLARRLGRSVAVDDLGFRLLAYSAHVDQADPVRTQIVLNREASPEVSAWVRRQGIGRAKGPTRVAGNAELGLLPRLCVPVRGHGVHFGYLWLIDPDHSLQPDDLTRAQQAADDAGALLFRDQIARDLEHAREGELLRDLFSDDAVVRRLAADQLLETGLLASRSGIVAICVQPLLVPGQVLEDAQHASLSAAVADVVARLPARECLRLVRPRHAVMLLPAATYAEHPDTAVVLHQRVSAALGGVEIVVGIGSPQDAVADALASARLAENVPRFRPVAAWTTLGVYAMLAALTVESLPADALHPAFNVLQSTEPDLLETLESFLDHAGDTSRVAHDLHVHRATVYSRIHRVEEVTGVSLDDGESRLALHLSIKLARLTGLI